MQTQTLATKVANIYGSVVNIEIDAQLLTSLIKVDWLIYHLAIFMKS